MSSGREPPRHARQVRLQEVGRAGQARLAAAEVRVPGDGLAAEVAARYLAGAGVGALEVGSAAVAGAARAVDPGVRLTVRSAPAAEPALPFEVSDPVAREVARGGYAALLAMRAILERGGG